MPTARSWTNETISGSRAALWRSLASAENSLLRAIASLIRCRKLPVNFFELPVPIPCSLAAPASEGVSYCVAIADSFGCQYPQAIRASDFLA